MNIQNTIYIAGHAGLVGSAIHHKMVERGYGRLVFRSREELDLRDQRAVHRFIESERPTHVILAAARVGGIVANNTRRAEFLYDNLMITANVIQAAKDYGVKKLINLGSSCIYPRHVEQQPIQESALLSGKLEPTNEPYAIAKIAGIKLCRAMYEQYGCNFFSVMPPNLYGPNDRFDLTTSHVLPAMIRKCHLGKLFMTGQWEAIRHDLGYWGTFEPASSLEDQLHSIGITNQEITFWGSGTPLREFLHVDDLADAVLMLLNQSHAAEVGEIINIGSGEEISICDLAVMIAGIVGYQGEIHWDHQQPDGTTRKVMDNSRIRMMGWQPIIAMEEGIRQTYRWYLKVVGMEGKS
jgi:GDP-L-fucose synthase